MRRSRGMVRRARSMAISSLRLVRRDDDMECASLGLLLHVVALDAIVLGV